MMKPRIFRKWRDMREVETRRSQRATDPWHRGFHGPRGDLSAPAIQALLRLAPIEEVIPLAAQRSPQFQEHRQAREIDPVLDVLIIPGAHAEPLSQSLLSETRGLAKCDDIFSEAGARGAWLWLTGRHARESPKPGLQNTRLYLVSSNT